MEKPPTSLDLSALLLQEVLRRGTDVQMSFSMTCTTLNPSLTRIPSDKLNPSDNLLILPPQFPIPQLSELIFKISNMVVSYDYCHLKILKNFLHWSWHSIERNLIFSLTLRILVQAYMYTKSYSTLAIQPSGCAGFGSIHHKQRTKCWSPQESKFTGKSSLCV